MTDDTYTVEEATGRKALDIGVRFIEQGLEELRDGRGYDDRGSVEMHLTSALAFLRGVFPENESPVLTAERTTP